MLAVVERYSQKFYLEYVKGCIAEEHVLKVHYNPQSSALCSGWSGCVLFFLQWLDLVGYNWFKCGMQRHSPCLIRDRQCILDTSWVSIDLCWAELAEEQLYFTNGLVLRMAVPLCKRLQSMNCAVSRAGLRAASLGIVSRSCLYLWAQLQVPVISTTVSDSSLPVFQLPFHVILQNAVDMFFPSL